MDENHWNLGTWRGVPVSMHWTFLLSCAWLFLITWSLVATAIASVALLALYFAHEFGHVAVLRRKRIPVESIVIAGLHGRTSHGWASGRDQMHVAWGGVAAQLVVLVLALTLQYALVSFVASPLAWTIAGPVLLVWTKLNVFLMVIALLPIGPFDGRDAWTVVARARGAMRKRRVAKAPKPMPEPQLTEAQHRALEASSEKAAADLLAKFGRNEDRSRKDA